MDARRKAGLTVAPLLSALMLGGCVSQSDYDALKAQNESLQGQNQQLREQLAAEQTQAGRLQEAIKYTINSDLLFAPGSWTMKERGKRVMADMAAKLAPGQRNNLIVAGYTDNAAIGPGLRAQGVMSNEELSRKRAESVMQFLISQGVKPSMISAQGLGEANPVASNDTPQGRAKNRRVEISVAAQIRAIGSFDSGANPTST